MSQFIKIRYGSFDQFFRMHKEDFQKIQNAKSELKSPRDLAMTGNLLAEAERLAFYFLNLKNVVSDLMFCVGASVGDAKHDIKVQMAIAYRDITGKVGDKKIEMEAQSLVVKAHQTYNDLEDLKTYLQNKYADFDTNHYYYRNISRGDQ